MIIEKETFTDRTKDKFTIRGLERGDLENLVTALETHISSKNCWHKKPFSKILNKLYELE